MRRTLKGEWAEAARTLAQYHASEAAQRHGRYKARELPSLFDFKGASASDQKLGRVIAFLMRDMSLHTGRRGELAAAALMSLAEALETVDETTVSKALAEEITSPRYCPGVDP